MAAVEEDTRFTRCSHNDPRCSAATPCVTHGLWNALSDATGQFLSSVSLVDVIAGGRYSAGSKLASFAAKATGKRTYLDYNATAPLRPEAKAAMIAALDAVGNPSSVHAEGRRARSVIESARESVALLVGAKPSEIVFTSGATEANAWALAQRWGTIFTSGTEHDSVLAPARNSAADVVMLPLDPRGVVKVEGVAELLSSRTFAGPAVVALQLANNETGIIQPIVEIAELGACSRDRRSHRRRAGRRPHAD